MKSSLVGLLSVCCSLVIASDSPEPGPKAAGKYGPPDDPLFYRTDVLLPGQTTAASAGGEEGEGENDDGESEMEYEGGKAPQPTVRAGTLLPAPIDVVVETRLGPAVTAAVIPPPDPVTDPAIAATVAVPTVIIGDPTEPIAGQLQLRDAPSIGLRPYQHRYRESKSYRSLYDERRPAPLAYSSIVPSQQTVHIVAPSPSVYPVQQQPAGSVHTVSNNFHKEINFVYHKDAPVKTDYYSPSQSNLFLPSDYSRSKVTAAQPSYPAQSPAYSYPIKVRKPYPAGYRIADSNSPKLGLLDPTPPSVRPHEHNPPYSPAGYPETRSPAAVHSEANSYQKSHVHNGHPVNYPHHAHHEHRHGSPHPSQPIIDVIPGHPNNHHQNGQHPISRLHHHHDANYQIHHGADRYQSPPLYQPHSVHPEAAPRYPLTHPHTYPHVYTQPPPPPPATEAPVTEAPEPPAPAEPTPAPPVTHAPPPPKPAGQVYSEVAPPYPLYPHPVPAPHTVIRNYNSINYVPDHYNQQPPHKPAGHAPSTYPEALHVQGYPHQTVPTPSALHHYNAVNYPTPTGYQAPIQSAHQHKPVGHVYAEVATYTHPVATPAYQQTGGSSYGTSMPVPPTTHYSTPYQPAPSTEGAVTPVVVDYTSPRCAQAAGVPYCLIDYDYPINDITAFITQYPDKYNLLRPMVPWTLAPTSASSHNTGAVQAGQTPYSTTGTSPGSASLDQYSSTPSTSGMCASHIHNSAKLLRSTNDQGKWKVIVHLPETYQMSHLEICDRNRTCQYMDQHIPTQCAQNFVLQQMMVYSSEFGIHVDQMRIPRGCQCQVIGNVPYSTSPSAASVPSPSARAPYATPMGQ